MTMRRVMVTGAGGFIGSRIVERLRRDGVDVTVLIRDGRAAGRFERAGCSVVLGDVTVPGSLDAAAKGCGHVVHCAVGGSSLQQARRINVAGTMNVVRACADAGVARVVYLSSVAAHGRRWPPLLREDTPLCEAGDAYALSKAESERQLADAAASFSVEITTVRPSIVYGPGAGRILDLLDRIRYGRIRLIDEGRGLLNLVHVADLVDGIVRCLNHPDAAGEAFLLSGAAPVRSRDLIAVLARMAGKVLPPSRSLLRARIEHEASLWYFRFTRRPQSIVENDLHFFTQRSVVCIDKARAVLGYNPRVTLADGMREIEASLRDRGFLA